MAKPTKFKALFLLYELNVTQEFQFVNIYFITNLIMKYLFQWFVLGFAFPICYTV
ncbi:protein of unknown function [Ruminococcaceae bacterium BL-6]|nr:protein of unknown function [Ruminococcaceae bacterium BL-6]